MRLGHKLLLRERGFESPELIAFVRCRHADKWGKGEIEKAARGGVTVLTQNKALYPFINPLAEFPVNRLTSWQVDK
mgnify:CR=1 FL=1